MAETLDKALASRRKDQLSQDAVKAVGKRLADSRGKALVSPVVNYLLGNKTGNGLAGELLAKAQRDRAETEVMQQRSAARKAPKAGKMADDPDADLWRLLDERVMWSEFAGASPQEEAGIYGVKAIHPSIADRYRPLLNGAQLIGIDLRGLTPEQQRLLPRIVDPAYFERERTRKAEQQNLASRTVAMR